MVTSVILNVNWIRYECVGNTSFSATVSVSKINKVVLVRNTFIIRIILSIKGK